MLCKLRCMIYAPLSQTHGNAASVLCFSQRHSEAVGAYILLCRILCTVTCLCVAEACLRENIAPCRMPLRHASGRIFHRSLTKQRPSIKASCPAMRLHSRLFHLEFFEESCNHRAKLAKLLCLWIIAEYPLQKMGKVKNKKCLLFLWKRL